MSLLGAIEGLGTKRIFGIYLGINQNLSKLSKLMSQLELMNWYCLILSSHSSSSSLLSYTLPLNPLIFNSINYLSIIQSYSFIFYITLFQLSMISFVVSHDIIITSFYWDLLGLISYLPINFWSSKINCGIKAVLLIYYFLILYLLFIDPIALPYIRSLIEYEC